MKLRTIKKRNAQTYRKHNKLLLREQGNHWRWYPQWIPHPDLSCLMVESIKFVNNEILADPVPVGMFAPTQYPVSLHGVPRLTPDKAVTIRVQNMTDEEIRFTAISVGAVAHEDGKAYRYSFHIGTVVVRAKENCRIQANPSVTITLHKFMMQTLVERVLLPAKLRPAKERRANWMGEP